MKTALVLLCIGLFLGLAAPYLWADRISDVSAQLPQFLWSKSPLRVSQWRLPPVVHAEGYISTRYE